jgi:hypothetical protein
MRQLRAPWRKSIRYQRESCGVDRLVVHGHYRLAKHLHKPAYFLVFFDRITTAA